jgi:hypothetical protein
MNGTGLPALSNQGTHIEGACGHTVMEPTEAFRLSACHSGVLSHDPDALISQRGLFLSLESDSLKASG